MTRPEVPPAPQGRGRPDRPPRRRPSARALLPLAAAAWVVLEIWLMVLVSDATSPLLVVLLLLAGFVVGAVVIKRAGTRAWRGFAEAFEAAAGRAPGEREPAPPSGAGAAMLGGALLMLPGFASDVLGLLCLFPPTRALLRRAVPRARLDPAGPYRQAYEQARIHRPDGKVVPGEVVDRDGTDAGGTDAGGADRGRADGGRADGDGPGGRPGG
jgi:UPF0716 protein FxsA